jgi:hypothetical protein
MYGYFFARRFWQRGSTRPSRVGFTTSRGSGAPPLVVFARLGLTEKDGWPPADAMDAAEAARKWLKDHASSYRIRRLVPQKREPGK